MVLLLTAKMHRFRSSPNKELDTTPYDPIIDKDWVLEYIMQKKVQTNIMNVSHRKSQLMKALFLCVSSFQQSVGFS